MAFPAIPGCNKAKRWKEGKSKSSEKMLARGAGQGLAWSGTFFFLPGASVCSHLANPGFIGCLCPAMLVGLTVEGAGGGGGRTHVPLCDNTLIRPEKEPDLVAAFLKSP